MPCRHRQYTQPMPDWLIAAVAAALPAFIAGWLAGRVRWRREQSKIVIRLLATSDKALEALDRGGDPSDALTGYEEAFAEADLLLPRALQIQAEHLSIVLRHAALELRLDRTGPTAGAKLYGLIQAAQGSRTALRSAAKKHFRIPHRQ